MRAGAELAFAPDEYRRRLAAVRARMTQADLDLLIVSSPESICYLSGYESAGYFVQQALLVDLAAEPILIIRALEVPNAEASCIWEPLIAYRDHENATEEIAALIANFGTGTKRVGAELRSRALSHAQVADLGRLLPNHAFVDSFGVVEGARLIKSEAELACIRRAGRIVEAGMRACFSALGQGRSERDVAAAAYHATISAGSEWTGAPAFVSSGPRSARAHTTWSDRVLAAGDPVFLEVNAAVSRYHAALMRPACIAPAAERFRSNLVGLGRSGGGVGRGKGPPRRKRKNRRGALSLPPGFFLVGGVCVCGGGGGLSPARATREPLLQGSGASLSSPPRKGFGGARLERVCRRRQWRGGGF